MLHYLVVHVDAYVHLCIFNLSSDLLQSISRLFRRSILPPISGFFGLRYQIQGFTMITRPKEEITPDIVSKISLNFFILHYTNNLNKFSFKKFQTKISDYWSPLFPPLQRKLLYQPVGCNFSHFISIWKHLNAQTNMYCFVLGEYIFKRGVILNI